MWSKWFEDTVKKTQQALETASTIVGEVCSFQSSFAPFLRSKLISSYLQTYKVAAEKANESMCVFFRTGVFRCSVAFSSSHSQSEGRRQDQRDVHQQAKGLHLYYRECGWYVLFLVLGPSSHGISRSSQASSDRKRVQLDELRLNVLGEPPCEALSYYQFE